MKPRILVIDDEKNIRRTLGLVLEGEGYDVTAVGLAKEGLAYLETEGADLVILDIKLPGMDGVSMLERIRENPDTRHIPVIMISGHASLSEAVETVRKGATDFFEKPLDRDAILIRVHNCLKQVTLEGQVKKLKAEIDVRYRLVGESPVMQDLLNQLKKVAPTRSRVLITGESGTGKELIARALHDFSPRKDAPFIKVNCAAIPSELIESELFGYERGAFTGATGRKQGQFELADTGTLFLDEIGDMSLSAQAKVLRALQSGEISRVGGQKTLMVDVRVLAATNKDLAEATRVGAFREDLFFRLNVVPLHSPPLRDRLEDVPQLLDTFIADFCKENGYHPKSVSPKARDLLCAYDWPGNVRELKNIAERLIIMSGDVIDVDDLPHAISRCKPTLPPRHFGGVRPTLKAFREAAERQFIGDTLEENDWNISKTAIQLGIERTNLHKKMKALSLVRRQS